MRANLAFFLVLLGPVRAADSVEPARRPVLVELFTSEGCSSCPPADALLAKLDEMQPVAGITVIALEEHVDYWDRLGWRDPYSSSEFTLRQQQCAERLHLDSPYTPQMVVDGRREFVGNDARRAWSELAKAAGGAKIPVKIAVKNRTGEQVSLAVRVDAAGSTGDVLLAITESGLATDVARGENGGRNVKHSAVVRKLSLIGKLKAGEVFSSEPVVKLGKEWKPEHLRAVVFVEERGSGNVLGAGEVALGR